MNDNTAEAIGAARLHQLTAGSLDRTRDGSGYPVDPDEAARAASTARANLPRRQLCRRHRVGARACRLRLGPDLQPTSAPLDSYDAILRHFSASWQDGCGLALGAPARKARRWP